MHWALDFRGRPHQVALGVALGVFIAFTPTFGIQMAMAVIFATFLQANRAAALAGVWISNPLTMVPMYLGAYYLGLLFMPGQGVTNVRERLVSVLFDDQGHWLSLQDQVTQGLALGEEILVPMAIGGTLLGLLVGAVSYGAMRVIIRIGRSIRIHHHRRKKQLAQRKERKKGKTDSASVPTG